MEADLQRFYGVDLADVYRGRLSLRRLAVLIDHLPTGSATWARLHGIPEGWSLTDFLLADLFQVLTGEEHPSRPKAVEQTPEARASDLAARLRAQRERLAASNP